MPTSERVSIKDIARAANFSHFAVSRALRNGPLVRIETSALNRGAAEEQGYTVRAVAHTAILEGIAASRVGAPGAPQEEIASYAAAKSRARAERSQVQ
jgi:DNA-binding LacI/PurR family transcriptional regulator